MEEPNPTELHIIKIVMECRGYLSTTEVARLSGTSWNSASKYLEKFYRKGWIERRQRGNRVYWRAHR